MSFLTSSRSSKPGNWVFPNMDSGSDGGTEVKFLDCLLVLPNLTVTSPSHVETVFQILCILPVCGFSFDKSSFVKCSSTWAQRRQKCLSVSSLFFQRFKKRNRWSHHSFSSDIFILVSVFDTHVFLCSCIQTKAHRLKKKNQKFKLWFFL